MNNEEKIRFEQLQIQMTSIHEQLQLIADRTMSMALVNIANTENDEFNLIMSKQKKLTDEMGDLIKEYEEVFK